MDVPRRPRLRDDLVVRRVDDDFVVYDPRSDRSTILNLSAAAVFDLCDGERTTDDIVGEISTVFAVEKRSVEEDVRLVLTDFLRLGLLTLRDPSAP